MNPTHTLVVTSIHPPNAVMRALAAGIGAAEHFLVIGDTKSPADFALPGARFVGVEEQLDTGLSFARSCPTRHYARKNIGYLLAMRGGGAIIQETDDDNLPEPGFFDAPGRQVAAPVVAANGWTNIYRYFSDLAVWPRGLPLDRIHATLPELPVAGPIDSPIRQGLADGNPDVDAIFRLVLPGDVAFRRDRQVALGRGSWCPFNSQNTLWFAEAFPLMYLPAYCSFRMTDIWRSLVAQRIAWENSWSVLFHGPTVRQERNVHDLMTDFADEVPGYLHNAKIASVLEGLPLESGAAAIPGNLVRCYQALTVLGLVGEGELPLLRRWLEDLELCRAG